MSTLTYLPPYPYHPHILLSQCFLGIKFPVTLIIILIITCSCSGITSASQSSHSSTWLAYQLQEMNFQLVSGKGTYCFSFLFWIASLQEDNYEDYYYANTIPSLISDMSKLSHSLYNLFITCGGEGGARRKRRGGREIGQQHTFIANLLTTSPLLYCVSFLKYKNNVNINNDSTLTWITGITDIRQP